MMNDSSLVNQIVSGVVRDTAIWVAFIGLFGVAFGALVTVLGNVLLHWLKERDAEAIAEKRKELLKNLLGAKPWRRLSTLSRVIGATEEQTRGLLISIEARGSEKARSDGEELWGLIDTHPLKDIDE